MLGGKKADTGELTGTVEFGGRRLAAMLHQLNGTWVLAIQSNARKVSDLVPHLRGTIADDLSLGSPLLVLSSGKVQCARMNAAASSFYRSAFGNGSIALDLERGINLVAPVTPSGVVQRTFGLVGLGQLRAVLTGVLLRDCDGQALAQARKNGTLKDALRKGTMLKASLPSTGLRLPAGFRTGPAFLFVTGEPGVGLGFSLTMAPRGGSPRQFECQLAARKTDTGLTEASIFANSTGRWENALGIRGFNLDQVAVVFSIDAAQRFGVGVKAKMAVGHRQMDVAGKILLHLVTGAPAGGAFEGHIDRLSSDDLLALMSARSRNRGAFRCDTPGFELRNVGLRVAPGGGDSNLGIQAGFALRGALYAFGRSLANVDGEMDDSPMLNLKGRIADFDLGPVGLRGCQVDIKLATTRDAHFRLHGASKLAIVHKSIDLDANATRVTFATSDRVGGVYESDMRFQSAISNRPSWDMTVRFKNDFSRTLEQDFSRRALAWAKGVERDFAKAKGSIDGAQRKVSGLETQVAAARRQVQGDRRRMAAGVHAKEKRISSLDKQVQSLEKQLRKKQDSLKPLDKAAKSAKKAWEKAKRATANGSLLEKGPLKVAEGAKWTAYKSAKAAYDVASGALRELNPKLNKLRAERVAAQAQYGPAKLAYEAAVRVPVDVDPRVAGLIGAMATARATLTAAKAAVSGTGTAVAAAGRVTAWAARNSGNVLALDSASFGAKLDSYLRGGRVGVDLAVRLMGQRRSLQLHASSREIAQGKLFESLWQALEKSL
ncbi:MAG: hypothetical protein H6837_21660 [Planctomycetes bacterium]|nr:hypothetical protein [Planctomycetota bacterium]